jgi:hypothetical protein
MAGGNGIICGRWWKGRLTLAGCGIILGYSLILADEHNQPARVS